MIERLLFYILSRKKRLYEGINSNEMKRWLIGQYQDMGFQNYFKYRDLQILKTLGTGLKDEQYWMYVGRRAELLHLAGQTKAEYERELKKKEE